MKAGDVVKVKVLEVDAARKRIALTMRLDDEAGAEKRGKRLPETEKRGANNRSGQPQREKQPTNSAMADAFAKLKR